jgi:TrmH family RNA methyltransferase
VKLFFRKNFPKENSSCQRKSVRKNRLSRNFGRNYRVYKTKEADLSSFKPKEDSTIIIVEGVEKPGNLGAILRSCEAFGIDALLFQTEKPIFIIRMSSDQVLAAYSEWKFFRQKIRKL